MNDFDPEVLELAREEANECLDRIEQNLLALETGSAGSEVLEVLFRDAHSVKGGAGMVGWQEAASIAHAMEDRLSDARDRGALPASLADPLLQATDALRRTVAGETGLAESAIELVRAAETGDEPEGEAPEVAAPPDEPAPPREPAPARRDSEEGGERRTIRVEAAKVDKLLDAVGETTLHQRRLEYVLADHDLDDAAEQELDLGGRLLEEFQDAAVELRTLPLSSITGPFARAVRDLARREGKEAELETSGTETQLDRSILDGLSDVITHLLRNSVAHGLETPEEREAAGKPARGKISLRAGQRAGMVEVVVADDGGGVKPELIERARERGSLADVLAEPGVSTAKGVTDVAGRGVGLDAVRAHVEELGGSIEVRSEPGAGTEVILLLPLTLALLHVLICERGGQAFAIPMGSVQEVVAVGDTTSLGGEMSIDMRGEAVPLRDIAVMLGGSTSELSGRPPAVVVAMAGKRVAVAFDEVHGDQEVVLKTLGPMLASVPGYLGAAILGDGRVALVLDPAHVLKLPARARTARAPEASAPATARRVLVVDDQFTVRELQRSILETSGYEVELAIDGREALAKIEADGNFDLVLTDVEMPTMTGLELLEAVRANDDTAGLPIVVVTSKGSEEDRRRGLEAGADAYIVKEQFDQQALLETIERLIGR